MSDTKKAKRADTDHKSAAAAKRIRKVIEACDAARRARGACSTTTTTTAADDDEVSTRSAASLLAENDRLKTELAALRSEKAAHTQRGRDAMFVRMVEKLIPTELTRDGTYTIEKATVHGDFAKVRQLLDSRFDDCHREELARVVFSVEEKNSVSSLRVNMIRQYSCWLTLDVADEPSLTFHYVAGTMPIGGRHYVVSITRNGQDLDAFEETFCRLMHENTSSYIPAFSTRPAWAYILLAMLTYNEHVFDDAYSMHRRVREDTADGAAADILETFASTLFGTKPSQPWEMIPKYLVRLMPREFALSINGLSDEVCRQFFIRK